VCAYVLCSRACGYVVLRVRRGAGKASLLSFESCEKKLLAVSMRCCSLCCMCVHMRAYVYVCVGVCACVRLSALCMCACACVCACEHLSV
jgi:hypothetical protein